MELDIYAGRKSFTPEGIQIGWDAHSIATAQECLRKYQYSILEGWKPNTLGDDLFFGRVFATALEHYYKYVAMGMSWEEALEEVTREALEETWIRPDTTRFDPAEVAQDGIVDTGKPWVPVNGDTTKTRENLIRTIVWYIDQFHDEPIKVLNMEDGRPAVELSFRLPVDNGITFCGHLDRVVEFQQDPYVMDQKTTKSTIGPYWFRQFKPKTQFSMYGFAGSAIFHTPMKGVIVDGVQVAQGFSKFVRNPAAQFTESELNEFYDNAMWYIALAQEATRRLLYEGTPMPHNPESCHKYNGCDFREVCSVGPGLRRQFLKGGFHRKELWDPMEAR